MKSLLPFIVIGIATSLNADGPTLLRRVADQLKQKISTINQRGASVNRRAARTTVTEREVNAYLAFEPGLGLPAGVLDPSISILGTDRVTGRAVVDLDRV